ncbi:hypothetical protein GSI_03859 [Ganoderma sinense ZZ0214-1]|uniref:Uncharacterized protein n=1 Tax=Ganoderma sinense ZZ0214-1 TaxID=1077348 RepID=A0A2G8SKQ5_9APHY|nr:hypothetical protein GSI_03859 [Ganoderma sinense ZZ0214-1]
MLHARAECPSQCSRRTYTNPSHLTMLPIAWITCCFLLGALVGTINKAGRGPFMVLARRAYSTSISPRTIHPQLAPPIGLPTLTGRVDVPTWPSGTGSCAVDAKATHITAQFASYPALYDVYSGRISGWLPIRSDHSALVPLVGGVSVLLAILLYLLCTSSGHHSKQKHAKANPVASIVDDTPKIPQLCTHPSPSRPTVQSGTTDDQVARNIPADFKRIRAELVQLRKAVDALVAHRSKAEETLHKLNATHEELRGLLESINDRSSRDSSSASSSNPWAIPSDHDAFSNSHFSSDSVQVKDTAPRPAALDDDNEYLSTALGLTNWSDIPPRNGYYPTLDLLLPVSRSERGSGQEAWWVPSDELRAWIFPRGAEAGSFAPARDPDGAFRMPDAPEAGVV